MFSFRSSWGDYFYYYGIFITRQNGIAEETTLTITGTIDLIDFGQVVNSIQESKYRYKATDSNSWPSYTNITVNINYEGNISFNDLIQGDTANSFDIGNYIILEF